MINRIYIFNSTKVRILPFVDYIIRKSETDSNDETYKQLVDNNPFNSPIYPFLRKVSK